VFDRFSKSILKHVCKFAS